MKIVDKLGAETTFFGFFLYDALLVKFVFQVFQQFWGVDLPFEYRFSIIEIVVRVN